MEYPHKDGTLICPVCKRHIGAQQWKVKPVYGDEVKSSVSFSNATCMSCGTVLSACSLCNALVQEQHLKQHVQFQCQSSQRNVMLPIASSVTNPSMDTIIPYSQSISWITQRKKPNLTLKANSLAKSLTKSLPKNYKLSSSSVLILQSFALQFLHQLFTNKEWKHNNQSIRPEDVWITLHSFHEYEFLVEARQRSKEATNQINTSKCLKEVYERRHTSINPLLCYSDSDDDFPFIKHFT